MHKIGHVRETPGELEVAVVKLTTKDHQDLHSRREEFIIKNKIFGEQKVKEVEFRPEKHPDTTPTTTAAANTATEPETWMSVIMHYPSCRCVATCTPIQET